MAQTIAQQVKAAQDAFNYQKGRLRQAQSKSGGRAMGQMNVASALKALASRKSELDVLLKKQSDMSRQAAIDEATRKAEEDAAAAAAELAAGAKDKEEDGTTVLLPDVEDAGPISEVQPNPEIAPVDTSPVVSDPVTNPDSQVPRFTYPVNDPNPAQNIGVDPITGNPIGPNPTPVQGGDLPPVMRPPAGSRDWMEWVGRPTSTGLPNQLERSGPIRRVTPTSQLFNNPLNRQNSGVPTTALGDALRGGSNGQV